MATTTSHDSHSESGDALGSWTGDDRVGLLWFVVVLIASVLLVIQFARIDGYLYSTKGEYLNIEHLRTNRLASFSVGSGTSDERLREPVD